jgi:uncharacterized protein (TIGR03437 family)
VQKAEKIGGSEHRRTSWLLFGFGLSCFLHLLIAVKPNEAQAAVLWSAGQEMGDYSEWKGDGLGGEYNTGSGVTVLTTEKAHSGTHGLKLTVDAPPGSGNHATRNFRWGVKGIHSLPVDAYYSAWYYFPQSIKPAEFWNIFQWKTKISASVINPTMVLNIDQRADGHMYVYLWDWIRSLDVGDAAIDLPLNQWIHIEAFYRHATDATGHVTFWQDGRQIIDVANVQTQWPSTDEDARQWSIDSYTNGLTPSAATIYVDDAVISTTRVGSGSTGDVNPEIDRISNAASWLAGQVAPGQIVSVLGTDIGPNPPVLALDERGFVTTELSGTRVLFDGVPAPLLYVSVDQVNAVAPYELAPGKSALVMVERLGQTSKPVSIPVVESNPGLFTSDFSGQGQGVIFNQDGSLNATNNPAKRGSTVSIFATGEGQTNPPGVDGKLADSALPVPKLPVQLLIGGYEAEIQYAGGAQGWIDGLLQITARIPPSIQNGRHAVVLRIGAASSQPGVMITVW